MLNLVGNAPSSGSTLLADLLDSATDSACGPELEFFCNKYLYNFKHFQKNIYKTSHTATLRATGIFPQYGKLSAYGLTKDRFEKMIHESSSLPDFFNAFTTHYSKYRRNKNNSAVFEKTPQNINCIEEFLQSYPNGFFVIIVRNPLYVYNSLVNRGWGNYTALCTWLISNALIQPYLSHNRIRLVKYEELVMDPFTQVSSLLSDILGEVIEPQVIEKNYKQNLYRRNFAAGLKSWEANREAQIINANQKQIPEDIKAEFSKLLTLKISKRYANHYEIPEISFKHLLREFGYFESIMNTLKGISIEESYPRIDIKDYRKLIPKWLREVKIGYAKITNYRIYFEAVETMDN
jgi:hypothetical protein